MRVEALPRPLSIEGVRDGGVYALRAAPLVETNLFLKVGCLDDLFIKVPSARGFTDYRTFVKLARTTPADIRPLDESERFERLDATLARFAGFEQPLAVNREIAHYLLVHKIQYDRLRNGRGVGIPTARFGMVRSGRLLRSLAPALFQERVRGTTLWEMFDFTARRVASRWRRFLPAISDQLSRLLDSGLLNHIDWNIQNFVFREADERLFYVDLKPTIFVARHGNDLNLKGLRDYFIT